jgi:RNA polymerase sigma-70 factor (ECF subfamily)
MSLELEDQYDKIYKYCFFKVKNKDIAEDLTQETFLKYFSQTSYINRGKQLAYFYTIAKNQCTDYFRKQQPVYYEENQAAVDKITSIENNLATKQAVNLLTKELQEIILLRFSNELGIGEIATFLGISRFSVYRKINTALKELKWILREEDYSE